MNANRKFLGIALIFGGLILISAVMESATTANFGQAVFYILLASVMIGLGGLALIWDETDLKF